MDNGSWFHSFGLAIENARSPYVRFHVSAMHNKKFLCQADLSDREYDL